MTSLISFKSLTAVALVATVAWFGSVDFLNEKIGNDESVQADFKPIFDGKTLDGWEYDPVYWTVKDGAIVGEITPETILKNNTFIIWKG